MIVWYIIWYNMVRCGKAGYGMVEYDAPAHVAHHNYCAGGRRWRGGAEEMERRGGGEEEQRRWVRRRAGEEEGAGWRAGEEEEEEKQASCGTSTSTSHPSGCDMSHLRRRETWRCELWCSV